MSAPAAGIRGNQSMRLSAVGSGSCSNWPSGGSPTTVISQPSASRSGRASRLPAPWPQSIHTFGFTLRIESTSTMERTLWRCGSVLSIVKTLPCVDSFWIFGGLLRRASNRNRTASPATAGRTRPSDEKSLSPLYGDGL